MKVTYSQRETYLIPSIQMNTPKQQMGKYAMMRKTFLKEHRKGVYNQMLMMGTLNQHLLEIDKLAKEQLEVIMKKLQYQEKEVDKDKNPLEWIQYQNNLRLKAEEFIMPMIYK